MFQHSLGLICALDAGLSLLILYYLVSIKKWEIQETIMKPFLNISVVLK